MYAVRTRVVASIGDLISATGEAWVAAHVLPYLVELFHEKENSYLQRITALNGVREIAVRSKSVETIEAILPLLGEASNDAVPNVRSVCVRLLGEVCAKSDLLSATQMEGVVMPALNRLEVDPQDGEVRFMASESRRKLAV